MNPDRSSFLPIQSKLNQQKVLAEGDRKSSPCIWDDMQGWMEQRQREWDDEMTQLKNEFFTIKPDKQMTSRRSSSDASSLPEKMNSSSRIYDTERGSRMFCVTVDVSQFKPDEVNIRTQGSSLIVHAKHEEQREKKSVSREFNRRVDIPSHINPDTLRCFIRDDGTLQVEAELPSPSYDSSSTNRDSPFALENSSNFSDRLSDRDICSPSLRTDRDICNTSGTDRVIYSPPNLYRDTYNPQRNGREVLSPPPPPRRDIDFHTEALKSHWTTAQSQPRDVAKDGFNHQSNNIFTPLTIDGLHQTSRNIYGATRIDNDIYNSQRTPTRDISSATRIDNDIYNSHRTPTRDISGLTAILGTTTSDNRRTLYDDDSKISDDNRLNCVKARTGQEVLRPIAMMNGHEASSFSVVVDIGLDFEPHELAVQTVDRKLVVHAQHTNPRFGGYGSDIYREFDLPEDVDPGTITANLTPEGSLLIEAPICAIPYLVPVEQTRDLTQSNHAWEPIHSNDYTS